MKCNVCQSNVSLIFSTKILYKYEVEFFQCSTCGFIQTQKPFWLAEAYLNPIAHSDIGLVSRNLTTATILQALITGLFNPAGRFIDYGAGYGLLVRLMRDRGFDFYHYDNHCENLFSGPFTAILEDNRRFDILTAVEVFEHLTSPVLEIERMLNYSDTIIFTTEILPTTTPSQRDWWYYSFESGQHISLYSYKSLESLASTFSLYLYSNRSNFHILTRKPLSRLKFKLLSKYRLANFISTLITRDSLTETDRMKILETCKKQ